MNESFYIGQRVQTTIGVKIKYDGVVVIIPNGSAGVVVYVGNKVAVHLDDYPDRALTGKDGQRIYGVFYQKEELLPFDPDFPVSQDADAAFALFLSHPV